MKVKLGIENLKKSDEKKIIGLFSNISGVSSEWRRSIDIIKPDVVFTGEHGYYEEFLPGERYFDTKDPLTGIPFVTIYDNSDCKKFVDIEKLYVDIQDTGLRCFTYVSNLYDIISCSAESGFEVVILDRPNPISATRSFGEPKTENLSVVSPPFIPFLYPFTFGELGLFFAEKLNGSVKVIPMEGYQREMYYEDTGLPFSSPSPNLSSVQSVYLYPALVFGEAFEVSVGRGTAKPFRIMGSPNIDIKDFAKFLGSLQIEGMLWKPSVFIPLGDKFKGKRCFGAEFYVSDAKSFSPLKLGFKLMEYFIENKIPSVKSGNGNFIDSLYNEKILSAIEAKGAEKLYEEEEEKGMKFIKEAEKHFIYKKTKRQRRLL